MRWLHAHANSFPLEPQAHHISANKFIAINEGMLDNEYPGRYYYHREEVEQGGYPYGVRVAPEFLGNRVRPVDSSIISCRRTVNLQLRGQERWIAPGSYLVVWVFWFTGGRNSNPHDINYRPSAVQEDCICERFFSPTKESEVSCTTDSGYIHPWNLLCSVGRPKQYRRFLVEDFDLYENPFAARVLLQEGFQEKRIDPELWATLQNRGWCEVTGPIVEVGSDGELGFAISKQWQRIWVGGFSFGGVRLEPT